MQNFCLAIAPHQSNSETSLSITNRSIDIGSENLNPENNAARPYKNKDKQRIRWNKIFEPILVGKYKLKGWMFLGLGISLILWLLAVLAQDIDKGSEIFGYPAVIMSILSVSILIAFPFIFLNRLFKEFKFKTRFSRCAKKRQLK